ncbi:hypothetical protein EVAR_52347_1 [Eumeta japonica]|uniref:Uncharacterized protein n=1 Tax=Eumeta variegata TaxID=151549 RepID=A0A4C1Y371_EUMVA|nr:hypothetical protein EVAR_52347_1 [Eumeta japonica]
MDEKRKMSAKPSAVKSLKSKKQSPKHNVPFFPVPKETTKRPSRLSDITKGRSKEEAVKQLMAEMSTSEDDANRRKSQDSEKS